MNERMEDEIKRTVEYLRPSMPARNNRISVAKLFSIAASEINILWLLAFCVMALIPMLYIVKQVDDPMISVFCMAPLPAILTFRKYVFNVSPAQRELECTFKFTYSQVMSAKIMLLSGYMFIYLLFLAGLVTSMTDESFLRLALCGAVPSIYICSAVLLLSSMNGSREWITEASSCIWLLFSLAACFDYSSDMMINYSTVIFAIAAAVGCVLWAACVLFKMKKMQNISVPVRKYE